MGSIVRARWGPPSRLGARWPAALAGAALAHALIAAAALWLVPAQPPSDVPSEPTVRLVFIEAAPQPVAAETIPISPPPDSPPASAEPAAPPLPQAAAEPVVAPDAAARSPEPTAQTEPLPEPPPAPPQPPPQRRIATTRPERLQRAVEPPQPLATAPAAQQPSAATITAWQDTLAAWLTAHRVYPESARRRGIQGNVTVQFTVDPAGRVNDVSVLQGSGSSILDAAALAMLAEATLPPPPAASKQAISVQIRYALRD